MDEFSEQGPSELPVQARKLIVGRFLRLTSSETGRDIVVNPDNIYYIIPQWHEGENGEELCCTIYFSDDDYERVDDRFDEICAALRQLSELKYLCYEAPRALV